MHINVLSVIFRLDTFDETARMYRDTMSAIAREAPGFRGMMGLVNRDSGKFMSVTLEDTQAHLIAARESEVFEVFARSDSSGIPAGS